VCHLIDANSDTSYFRAIARRHEKTRFPVMIGSLAPEGPLQRAMRELGIATFGLDARGRRHYGGAIWRFARLLRREGVSLLHAHCFDATLAGVIAARLAQIPFIFTRHHSEHHLRLGKRWHTRVDGWCGRRAHRVIAVSEMTKRIMTEVEGVPEDKIDVVYNGMEPLQEPPVESVERLRRDLGLSTERVCLMLARLHEEKGHQVLFEALPSIVRRVGAVVVLLAGDGPHRARFEAEVRRSGLGSFVRFLGRRDDVPQLIALSSVVVVPSLAESFGFAALEAMSLGRPVVASSLGGIAEVVGECGVLTRPGNAESMVRGVCSVLEHPERAREIGEAGRVRARLFSAGRMLRGYEAVYNRVLANSKVAGGQLSEKGSAVAADR